MQEIPQLLRRFKVLTASFVVFIIVYIWSTWTATPDKASIERYHISAMALRELSLAIIIPYIFIWIIGLIGYMWLRNYTKALGDSSDGRSFNEISKGVLILVVWLPLSVVVAGLAAHYYGNHPSSTAPLIRFVNYFNIVLLLPAFYYVYEGSKQLVGVARLKAHGLNQRQAALFVVFSAIYVFIALSDTSRQVIHGTSAVATYYLPDWASLLTVIIPRLLTWFMGFAAVANIFLYRKKVKGAIYRAALQYLAIGLMLVVSGVITMRTIQSLSAILGSWSLGLLLLLIYVLLAVLGLGYFLIAKGAKRLLRIEQS